MPTDGVSGRLPESAYADVFRAVPVALLLIRADDLVMVEANAAYLAAVGLTAADVVGRHVFDVFPEPPAGEGPPTGGRNQVAELRGLLDRVVRTGTTQVAESLRYDIPAGDGFEVHWWNVVERPLLDAEGRVEHIVHLTEDVTELHLARDEAAASRAASRQADQRVTVLAEVALALTATESVAELEEVVLDRVVPVLSASTGLIVSAAPEGGWRTCRPTHPSLAQAAYDDPLPGPTVARTGRRVLLPDRVAGLTFDVGMAEVYERTGRQAWAFLPLTIGDRTLGALGLGWDDELALGEEQLDLLEALAAQCAQTLSRIESAEAQRRTSRRVQDLAEALQGAMLTPPPTPDHLDVVVRYRSAVDVAQVGGDWYDAFQQPDGATTLVIGDVVGHDNIAAGKMGQLRGLLRALAYDAEDSPHGDLPSTILTRFEYAARGLEVDELATAVLARVEQVGDTVTGTPRRVVRWSNAGNPPPVLLHVDGTTEVWDPKPDLILGVDPGTDRHDHVADFPDGSTLLLYTDGLIERRSSSIDEGMHDLREALSALAGVPLGELCDSLLARLAPHTGEDDIAMIAARPWG